ncbi:MAG: hypothetical protein JO033_11885, partial [Acidobacteriaceae bacterium]|nr:hypothetical protein [Acidobacteriaceae bacterium]
MGGRLSRWSPLAEWIVAPIGIACAFAITRGQALHGGRIFAAFQDTTYLVLPLFNYISGGMMHGQYPYWINTIVGGIPLYNNPQFSTLYPFYFFHWGLYGNALDALINLQKVTVLHLLIAYLNCYVFLRIVGLGRLPAFVGASIFGLSAEVMRYSTWVMIIAAYAWFPLALAAVLLILQRRHPKAGILIGVFACSMMALACPAQPLIHTLYACAVIYGFYVVLCLKSRQYEALLGSTKDLGLMVCIAAVISSPVLVPIVMSSQEYIRWVGHGSNVIGHQRIPFADFTSMQSDVSALAGTMVPARVSNIGSPFIGMGATFLAVLSIFRVRGNWILYPLWFIAIYALASATGAHLGLAFINYHLPLLNEIREPGRHLFLFIFAASALAAFGFAYLSELAAEGLKAVSTRKHLVVAIVFLVMLTASLLVDLRYLGHVTRLFLLAIFALSVIVIVLAFLVRSWHRSALLVAIAALVVSGSLQYPWRARPLNQSEYFTPANLASENALNQASSLDPKRDYRWLFSDDALNSEYWSMNASYYGLRSFQGYMNPLPYRQFDEVF